MPSQFRDLGKAPKDLLGKSYVADQNRLELTHKTPETSFDSTFSNTGFVRVETEFQLPGKASFVVESTSASKVLGTLKLKELFPGGTLKVKGSTANEIFVGLDYSRGQVAAQGDLKFDSVSGAVITASALYAPKPGYLVGGSVWVDQRAGPVEYVAGGGYSKPGQFEATVHVTKPVREGSIPSALVQYIHYLNAQVTLAAKVKRDLNEIGKTSGEVGGTYALRPETTFGAKMDFKGVVGLFALHNFNKNFALTKSAAIDLSNPSAITKFGLTFKYKN